MSTDEGLVMPTISRRQTKTFLAGPRISMQGVNFLLWLTVVEGVGHILDMSGQADTVPISTCSVAVLGPTWRVELWHMVSADRHASAESELWHVVTLSIPPWHDKAWSMMLFMVLVLGTGIPGYIILVFLCRFDVLHCVKGQYHTLPSPHTSTT